MLNKINLQQVASYGDEPQQIADLNTVNFIFGDNGSGKSTIARLIEDDQLPEFSNSSLEWDAYGSVQTLVYNRNFIDETLREKVKGIFTFGEKAGVKQDELDAKVAEQKKEKEKVKKLREALEGKSGELAKEDDRFKDKCWTLKTKYATHFDEAFKGFKTRELFKNKCLANIEGQPAEEFEQLQEQAKTFFNEQPDKIPLLPTITRGDLDVIETLSIFKLKILGKEDVPISGLIQRLGNSDWVRQGTSYISNQNLCPFCQQELPDALRQNFEDYFDETFTQNMSELNASVSRYKSSLAGLLAHFDSLSLHANQFFSFENIRWKVDLIRATFGKNEELLARKLREPSLSVELDQLSVNVAELDEIIIKVNAEITDFNTKLDNFAQEKSQLIEKIWTIIGSEAKDFHEDHLKISNPIQSAISGMEVRLKTLIEGVGKLTTEISELEKDLTSTAPSKDGINNILNSFGFDNFRIADAEEEGYYRIVRFDGRPAQDTLSEGERTFITFLYFYQLIQGSTSKSGLNEPRIVVFDDPVSSLDSKILFIVSTLIRSLYCSERLNALNIQQVVILTHNVYFHKEIAFMGGLKGLTKTKLSDSKFSHWVVRKQDGISRITFHQKNPIKTNYQLLWREVKICQDDPLAHPTLCNTLRRILENYFAVLGNYDLASLPDLFDDGGEKLVCKSLTSWFQDGSHSIFEGIDIGIGHDLSDQYIPVFKKIFEKTEQTSHYEMMMGSCDC
ncbi:AAA family ATPase [uncultured Pseudodesulfovibrio sp.]|uniref:AAA family ATPase n=1 Tax=uncultured Pseudodesulfovibrio sp. TaxID=2035858 RepID=UPI0029C7E179|nr:AAA family ATPase [uncultured Pseudodesulfovibrio sp.]